MPASHRSLRHTLRRQTVVLAASLLTTVLFSCDAWAQGDPDQRDLMAPEPRASLENCQAMGASRNSFKSLAEIELELQPAAERVPLDCSQLVFEGQQSPAALSDAILEFHWEPTNFFHHPLYFDDTPLERYGQSICPAAQPWISGTRFFLTFPVMPYKIGVDHTHDCITTLGKYRPGNCVPCVREVLFRGDRGAALLQAATTVGLVFLLP